MLAIADVAAAVMATASTGVIFGNSLESAFWSFVTIPVWIVLAKVLGLYDSDHRAFRHMTVDEVPKIAIWAITGAGLTTTLLALSPAGALDTPEAVRVCVIGSIAAFALRASARALWRLVTPPERAVVAGNGALADATRRKLELFPDIHVRVVCQHGAADFTDLAAVVDAAPEIDHVILASEWISESLVSELIGICRERRLKFSVVPPPRAMFGAGLHLSHVADLAVLQYHTTDVSRSTLLLKRAIDVIGSGLALALLAPVFIAATMAIKLDSRGPIFFHQTRAGLGGRPYRMHKFRTMVLDAEERLAQLVPFDELPAPMFKLQDDPRATRVGKVLRRWSVDELPQLWNVLKGDMSLVGPRPEQLELVERYAPEHRFRLSVKPGLTGPMQVYGRARLTFDERLAVEREYIETLSLGRDLRILALTPAAVWGRSGAF
jgi:exopolysaccharide biosynthesis polyprenyl glycosylphosphotransferase